MKYRFICIPLVILLFIACIPSAYATSYSDVDRARLGVEAFEAIMYVTDNVKSEDVAEPLCVVSADGSPLQYCIEEEIIP